jgi:hypothetical protein
MGCPGCGVFLCSFSLFFSFCTGEVYLSEWGKLGKVAFQAFVGELNSCWKKCQGMRTYREGFLQLILSIP